MLLDLSDLPHCLLQDGTFVRLDVEAVNVGEVGRDELSQLLDVLALLFPPTLVTPAEAPKGLDVAMTTSPPHAPSVCRPYGHTGLRCFRYSVSSNICLNQGCSQEEDSDITHTHASCWHLNKNSDGQSGLMH